MALALAGVVWMAGSPAAHARATTPEFERREIELQEQALFDVGIVDFNGDDRLDVYTTNHNDRQSLLANKGDGTLVDALSILGLDHSPRFPGYEVPAAPSTGGRGVYMRRIPGTDPVEGALRVVVREGEVNGSGAEAAASIGFLFPVDVIRDDGAEVWVEVDRSRPLPRYVAHFVAQGDALIELEPEQMAAPIEVHVDEAVPLSSVRVGPLGVTPPAHLFALQLRDRHGMSWGDFNRDGHLDVFIARGGLKRRVGEFAGLVTDELMLGTGSGFLDAISTSGIVKGSCRGRESSVVDFNRDGLLDIFYSCQGARPALWRQNREGVFSNRSAKLARVTGDHFRWLDLNGDRRDELLALRGHKLTVFRRQKGRWRRRQGVPTKGENLVRPAVADFDDDGDPDLFAASPQGNTLLINRNGELRARRPGRFGMPRRGSLDASWVDYDNDGRTDLYQAPRGIFRGKRGHRFKSTGLAASQSRTLNSAANWFDFNGDGSRDLLVAYPEAGYSPRLYKNRERKNHLLQVELTGPGTMYPAAGARVRVRSGGRVQTQWVGQNDGARYSQGHYRLYFGLGRYARARWIRVRWPDGTTRKLRRVSADRLVRVSFPSGRGSYR